VLGERVRITTATAVLPGVWFSKREGEHVQELACVEAEERPQKRIEVGAFFVVAGSQHRVHLPLDPADVCPVNLPRRKPFPAEAVVDVEQQLAPQGAVLLVQ
jgi:hypothetical protein